MGTKKLDFSIVVIGRRNHRKKSHGIERFILEAAQYVNKVIYFSSDKEKYAIEINNAISCTLNKLPKALSSISHAIFQNTIRGKLARRISQFLYLAFNPKLFIKVVNVFWHKKSHLEQLRQQSRIWMLIGLLLLPIQLVEFWQHKLNTSKK